MELVAGGARLVVEPDRGGRWASLEVAGLSLLGGAAIPGGHPPTLHGCFAMAPFAGRLHEGRLRWRGEEHELPRHAPPHAIHGTAVDGAWAVVEEARDRAVLEHELGPPWPFAGTVRQEVQLGPDGLDVRLRLRSREDQPVVLGLHPWFRRRLARGEPVRLHVDPVQQYERGEDGLPTGALVPPAEGPHDDCFLGLRSDPRLVWAGALELTLSSPVRHWVVFDERPEAVCVEPQTGPPDAVRLGEAAVVGRGEELVLPLRLSWTEA